MAAKGFILELRPTGSDERPPEKRLAQFLKQALRAFNFRCTRVRWIPDSPPGGQRVDPAGIRKPVPPPAPPR